MKNSIVLNKRNTEGNNALFYATKSLGVLKCGDVLKKLLSSGSVSNAENKVGHNALGHAIRMGCFMDSISTLISYGATFNVQDKHGYTKLMVAAERGASAIVDLLVKYDPDINKNINLQNKDGNTALMCAITEEGLECYVDSLSIVTALCWY